MGLPPPWGGTGEGGGSGDLRTAGTHPGWNAARLLCVHGRAGTRRGTEPSVGTVSQRARSTGNIGVHLPASAAPKVLPPTSGWQHRLLRHAPGTGWLILRASPHGMLESPRAPAIAAPVTGRTGCASTDDYAGFTENRVFGVNRRGAAPALRPRLGRRRPAAATSSACLLARFQSRCLSGLEIAGIPAGNLITYYRTARYEFAAVGLDPAIAATTGKWDLSGGTPAPALP